MRHEAILALGVLLGVGLSGCVGGDLDETGSGTPDAGAAGAPGTASMSGTVTDAEINPLKGARVGVVQLNLTVTTDDSGSFHLDGLPAGSYVVATEALGFHTAVKQITLAEGGVPSSASYSSRSPWWSPGTLSSRRTRSRD